MKSVPSWFRSSSLVCLTAGAMGLIPGLARASNPYVWSGSPASCIEVTSSGSYVRNVDLSLCERFTGFQYSWSGSPASCIEVTPSGNYIRNVDILSCVNSDGGMRFSWSGSPASCIQVTPAGNYVTNLDLSYCEVNLGVRYSWSGSPASCIEVTLSGNYVRTVGANYCGGFTPIPVPPPAPFPGGPGHIPGSGSVSCTVTASFGNFFGTGKSVGPALSSARSQCLRVGNSFACNSAPYRCN